ncbi:MULTISPECIES: phosphopantetheine-binding protein [Catenuloplanes]|uniref:Aryl carrier-like protein n=1 Tax=Catenuloplanes niger TaxID=587534 RepID=A0AAE3ZL05_9ACTN|nr:phosphopantetheine-binding protein [Catenuloplanes niger]MDR7321858.1 aryl carrier-like protein [Catenuloplanes niger]
MGMLSLERIRADVAESLGESPADLTDDENLLDRGLDSIRIMTLVEKWRRDGYRADYLDLAENPTVAGWQSVLRSS